MGEVSPFIWGLEAWDQGPYMMVVQYSAIHNAKENAKSQNKCKRSDAFFS